MQQKSSNTILISFFRCFKADIISRHITRKVISVQLYQHSSHFQVFLARNAYRLPIRILHLLVCGPEVTHRWDEFNVFHSFCFVFSKRYKKNLKAIGHFDRLQFTPLTPWCRRSEIFQVDTGYLSTGDLIYKKNKNNDKKVPMRARWRVAEVLDCVISKSPTNPCCMLRDFLPQYWSHVLRVFLTSEFFNWRNYSRFTKLWLKLCLLSPVWQRRADSASNTIKPPREVICKWQKSNPPDFYWRFSTPQITSCYSHKL